MKKFGLTPSRLWFGIFGVWACFLTGLAGTPGLIQKVRLRSLLEARQLETAQVETEIARLEAEIANLEKSRFAQEREIRRSLGYAASDEIIFDFSATSPEF